MLVVRVTNAFYLGQRVEGLFELDRSFKAVKGGENRRVSRKGKGTIRVYPSDALAELAANAVAQGKPVNLTVEDRDVGYEILEDDTVVERATPAPQPEPEVVVDPLAALRAEYEAATGREKAILRKRLRRREAKLAKEGAA